MLENHTDKSHSQVVIPGVCSFFSFKLFMWLLGLLMFHMSHKTYACLSTFPSKSYSCLECGMFVSPATWGQIAGTFYYIALNRRSPVFWILSTFISLSCNPLGLTDDYSMRHMCSKCPVLRTSYNIFKYR